MDGWVDIKIVLPERSSNLRRKDFFQTMLQEQTGSRITAFRNAVTGAGRCKDGEPSTYLFEHHFIC